MRIISGIYKGKNIYSVAGFTARPTTDFLKEMLFSTLFSLNPNMKNILDLYAGSGSLGFEAISRGSKYVTFVEMSQKAISTIFANIELLGCHTKCKVLIKKVEVFLTNPPDEKYDLIFADPPYNKDLVNKAIQKIFENDLLSDDGILIVEHSKNEIIDNDYEKYIFKEKQSGGTVFTFLYNKNCHSEERRI